MASKTIAQLLEADISSCYHGSLDVEVSGLFYDSRRVKPGGVFFALRGQQADGHEYIPQALTNGAAVVVSEQEVTLPDGVTGIRVPNARRAMSFVTNRFFDEPTKELPVIGVTGTNGKTTITYLLESILRKAGRQPAVMGTINYRFNEQVLSSPHTTPEAVDLLGHFAGFKRDGADSLVMEVSSHALDQCRVEDVAFKVGIFTNLTPEHLDFHGDMERYFSSKQRLFNDLLPRYAGRAVVNLDDPFGQRLASMLSNPLTCSADQGTAQIKARNVAFSLSGIDCTIETPNGALTLHSPLIGRFNLQNILCAVGAAIALDLPLNVISAGIEQCPQVPGRMERVGNDVGAEFVVDYAHTGDALEKALQTLKDLQPRRLISVFGCGGDRDRTKRPVMGEISARIADLTVLTSDNPRTEDPQFILDEVRLGAKRVYPREWSPAEAAQGEGQGFVSIIDRAEAIAFAVNLVQPGDLLLVAGKGHEDYQILGKERIHFDDREQVRLAIKARVGD